MYTWALVHIAWAAVCNKHLFILVPAPVFCIYFVVFLLYIALRTGRFVAIIATAMCVKTRVL